MCRCGYRAWLTGGVSETEAWNHQETSRISKSRSARSPGRQTESRGHETSIWSNCCQIISISNSCWLTDHFNMFLLSDSDQSPQIVLPQIYYGQYICIYVHCLKMEPCAHCVFQICNIITMNSDERDSMHHAEKLLVWLIQCLKFECTAKLSDAFVFGTWYTGNHQKTTIHFCSLSYLSIRKPTTRIGNMTRV